MKTNRPWGKAVVIGGSYSGLVTARVLSDFFSEVVLVERDDVDGDTGTHPGSPQGYHAHAILAKGGEILERLFPGLQEEMREAGAPVFDYGQGMEFLLPTGLAPRARTGVQVQTFTRDELERRLRRKVLALDEVTLMSGTQVSGLTRDSSGRVTGVTCRQPDAQAFELAADLVVDASGRSSSLQDWLGAAGVTVPPKRTVKAKITYTSMTFDRPEEDHPDYYVTYQMLFAPTVPRAGVVLAVEGNRWTCSLVGFEDQPPTDDTGFLQFAKSLNNPHLAEQIGRRTSQEPTYRYTNVDNQWRQYHEVKNWPDRLIAVGDAVCVFNPVFGQGLTVAAMEAELLHEMLTRLGESGTRKQLDGLAGGFQKRVGRLVVGPWTLSTNSDLMWNPDSPPLGARFAHWYNARLFRVAVKDEAVWSRFARVVNMVASPAVLFQPSVALKVLATAFTRRD